MNRRNFIQATAATLGATTMVQANDDPGREYYELRTYTLKAEKLPLLDAYLEKALLPAVERLGCGPVGVFLETESNERDVISGKRTDTTVRDGVQRLYVLIVQPSADVAASLPAALDRDAEYQKAASAFLAAKPADPVYQSCTSTLLRAIAGMPKIATPDKSKPRIFNLRTYGSNNERAAAKKVEMFEKGELEIFKEVKLTPVFFASAYSGESLPNLTYMLVFPGDPERDAAWQRFGKSPAWSKLKATPGYADNELLTKITNRVLTPQPYSGM
ncbi:MAG: NIPSNAP family protein [Gemmatales bacterium]